MTATMGDPVAAAEAILVAAARAGDLFAWERLVRRYQEPVYRVAYLVVRDTRLAEAASQSTFVRAYHALPSLEDDATLLPWLFRIASGEARQQRRDSGRPRRSARPVERSNGPQVPASAVAALQGAATLSPPERQLVGEAFERLGEDDRLTLASRYLLGLSRKDAASALSIPQADIDERLRIALGNLRTRMAAS
jgi:RNA polymerase sigma-70 factor, ECF subfamily